MSDRNLDLTALRGKAGIGRTLPPVERQAASPPPSTEDEEECAAFGYLRGIRDRALFLELRFANGNSHAFPYSWLGPMQYDPSAGLLLKFVGDMVYLVLLEGSNLNALVNQSVSLYDRGILRHRVSWVREMSRAERESAGDRDVVIERIHLLAHRPDEEPKGVAWLPPFEDRPAPSS
jgi:hypothetical protein